MAGINPPSIDDVIDYPAQYGIKVMGLAEAGFDELVKSVLTEHLGSHQKVTYTYKTSRQQRYLSITCTLMAESRQQLDAIYAHMRSHPKVLMVL